MKRSFPRCNPKFKSLKPKCTKERGNSNPYFKVKSLTTKNTLRLMWRNHSPEARLPSRNQLLRSRRSPRPRTKSCSSRLPAGHPWRSPLLEAWWVRWRPVARTPTDQIWRPRLKLRCPKYKRMRQDRSRSVNKNPSSELISHLRPPRLQRPLCKYQKNRCQGRSTGSSSAKWSLPRASRTSADAWETW